MSEEEKEKQLRWAALGGELGGVERLIAEGVDVNAKAPVRRTATAAAPDAAPSPHARHSLTLSLSRTASL